MSAPDILQHLTPFLPRLAATFDSSLRGAGFPMTGWSRAVLNFVWDARSRLLAAGTSPDRLPGLADDFRRHFHEDIPRSGPENLRHNPELFMDMLDGVKRCFNYELYKMHLPSIEDEHSKFSFVCNAFKKALECKNDVEK